MEMVSRKTLVDEHVDVLTARVESAETELKMLRDMLDSAEREQEWLQNRINPHVTTYAAAAGVH